MKDTKNCIKCGTTYSSFIRIGMSLSPNRDRLCSLCRTLTTEKELDGIRDTKSLDERIRDLERNMYFGQLK